MSTSLTFDFNYTFSKSEDLGSATEGGTYSGFIQNVWFPNQMWAVSNYDARHILNAFAVWHQPIGKGKALLSGTNKVVDQIVGGWMATPTVQWSSAVPTSVGDGSNW